MIEVDTHAAEEHKVENLINRPFIVFFLKLHIDQVLKLIGIKLNASVDAQFIIFPALLNTVIINHFKLVWIIILFNIIFYDLII